ncbi:hypothetical protein [Candidatus Amarobacter glycogenicus]|uniref:hypothetical protein n=1 Tax=Candidatus Amarobacter glycogenicus TaxID=3140699 RepID=UPI002A133F06|nr:hypothetical protein [Dehalococcoidia bacterium]
MKRWFAVLLLPVMLLGIVACGGGDDDDDDDGGGGSTNDTDDGRTDSSNATGTLAFDGKQYTMDMETCLISDGASKLTVLAGKLKGGDALTDFSASGIEDLVAIAVTKGDKGYIAAGVKLKIDGKSVTFDGDVMDPAAPAKPLKLKFATKC